MAYYSLIPSPIGWLGVVGHRGGIVTLLRGGKNRSDLERKIRRGYPLAVRKGETLFQKVRSFLDNYFMGKPVPPPRIDLSSQPPFLRKVLQQVRQIPYGEVRTYSWIAWRVGCPKGARACGQTLHKNPLPLLIPCHRVILKSGKSGGFTWGTKIKRKLLELETTN